MSFADSKVLTTNFSRKSETGTVLILACGAIAREVIDLLRINNLPHIDLHCLPAILHNTPDKIPFAVKNAFDNYKVQYSKIFLAYADCGTGGKLEKLCAEYDIEMIDGPHCYSFFEGNKKFEELGETTSFYLTDFLVRQFESFVWKPLGLDKHPELISMYFGNYEKLVYQSQSSDNNLIELAKTHAEKLNLNFEHRHTGFGDLEKFVKKLA